MTKNLPATGADNDPIKRFEKNLGAKIAKDMGKLMPQEMLEKIVSDAVTKRVNSETIQKQVRDSARERLEKCVKDHISKEEDRLKPLIEAEIIKFVPMMLAEIMMSMFKGQGSQIEYVVERMMERNRWGV